MPPIENDQVAWSVGLSVSLSPSEPDTVCTVELVGPRETPITY